eukprot:Clim_evm32s197 gene=Clim_evmTU32s197
MTVTPATGLVSPPAIVPEPKTGASLQAGQREEILDDHQIILDEPVPKSDLFDDDDIIGYGTHVQKAIRRGRLQKIEKMLGARLGDTQLKAQSLVTDSPAEISPLITPTNAVADPYYRPRSLGNEDSTDELEAGKDKVVRQRRMRKINDFFGEDVGEKLLYEQKIITELEREQSGRYMSDKDIRSLESDLVQVRSSLRAHNGHPCTGRLILTIHSVRDLRCEGPSFVSVRIDGQRVARSKGYRSLSTTTEALDASFTFYCHEATVVDLVVQRESIGGLTSVEGTCRMSIDRILEEGVPEGGAWLEVIPDGRMLVEASFVETINMADRTLLLKSNTNPNDNMNFLQKIFNKDKGSSLRPLANVEPQTLEELFAEEEREIVRLAAEHEAALKLLRQSYRAKIANLCQQGARSPK